MPKAGLFSFSCRAFTSVSVCIGDKPEFSARARGTLSSASEKALKAYCSSDEIWKRATVSEDSDWTNLVLNS